MANIYNMTDTWTDGSTLTAIKMNVTDTSSAADSKLLDLQVGGSSKLTVGKDGAITAVSAGSVIPFYYDSQGLFPSASTYHGALAHSHNDGAMYFAHSNAWNELASTTTFSNRNLIINGAMQVAQRGTQETGITSFGYYTVDRMRFGSGFSTFTMDQNTVTDLPGFTKSCKVTCTTAGSPTGTQQTNINYRLEGHDLQHLKKGTSDAESLTVSFWVKSGVTGTYTFELLDSNNSDRHVNSTYTVGAANTWEYKTITFAGDTTGAFTNDNNRSLTLLWYLGAGPDLKTGTLQTSWGAYVAGNRADSNQVNLASGNDSAVNYFEITGVQLEVGDTATPFEHRSYGEELALCQRYYFKKSGMLIYANSTRTANVDRSVFFWPVTMRAAPASSDVSLTFSAGGGTAVKEGITDTSCTFGQNNPSAAPVLSAIEASADL